MRHLKKVCAIAGTLAVLNATNVMGVITVTLNDTPYNDTSGGGGEFSAVSTGGFINNYSPLAKYDPTGAAPIGFETFCIEYNEHINYGVTYTATISSGAISGGSGGGISPITPYGSDTIDRISKGTAWLYSQFAAGTLAGYAYNTTLAARQQSSALLQNAIWRLEGELVSNPVNPFLASAITHFGSLTAAAADANGAYRVVALNLFTTGAHPQHAQDQLAIVPEPTTVIAGALLLLPFGVSTLRFLRRNRTT